jgi:putative ABC transport system permease protein
MSWIDGVRQRLRMVLRRRQVERELAEELRFHHDRDAEQDMARGVAGPEVRRTGALRFGGEDVVREAVRDEWTWAPFRGFGQDVRQGVRRLVQRPGFAIVALSTLALGIGANAAIFSLVRSVLLEPLPYGAADRIVHVWDRAAGLTEDTWLSQRELLEYRAATRGFEALAGYTDFLANLTDGEEPERVRAGSVTANLVDVLGGAPAHGRVFTVAEDVPGNSVVVIGHALWQRRLGGSASVLGQTIRVNGEPRTVIGIMPASFRLPLDYREDRPTELWIPDAIDATQELSWGNRSYYLAGLLAPGVTVAQADAELDAAMRAWCAAGILDNECVNDGGNRDAVPLQALLFRGVRPALLLLFGAVALVLLIACANVAHLLLARADSRRREVATQAALGASRFRIARQLLIESGVLAVIGGAAGVACAWVGLRVALAVTPVQVIRARTVELDATVIGFTALLALATTLLAGAAPALQLARVDVAQALRGGRGDASPMRRGVRRGLVVLETALAVVLVVGAVLLARTFAELRRIDLGYDTDRRLTMRVVVPASDYPDGAQVAAFFAGLLDRVRALPGVESAAAARIVPLTGTIGDWTITLEQRETRPGENPNGDWQVVTPGYFETLGMTLVAGRFLTPADDGDGRMVAVVNETMAARYWPNTDAVGQRFHLGTLDQPWIEIVGVARDVRHNAVVEDQRAEMYLPHAQFGRATGGGTPPRGMSLVVRTRGEPLALVAAVREQVRALDPSLPVSEVRTLDEIAAGAVAQPRFTSMLFGVFGALSLGLAAIGLYGVIAYTAARRTREMGIRIALGARGRSVEGLVVREGVALALAGAGLGVLGALWATRFLAGQLYGVDPLDPVTFVAVPLVLLAVAATASYLPARRAARISPIVALRTE